MQHRAATSTLAHPDDADLRAYLELLASDRSLSAAPADPAARAYLDLLASDEPLVPLTPADLLPAVAAGGRPQQRTSHRAARKPQGVLGNRSRHAVATVALAVGVSVAGASVAAGATPSRADNTAITAPAAAQTRSVAQTTADPAADPAITDLATTDPTADHAGSAAATMVEQQLAERDGITTTDEFTADDPQLSYARNALKARPKPVVVATAAAWVNPLPEASVTSCFGERWGRLHAGVDLAAPQGTRIRAAGAGVIVSAGAEGGYGNAVLIDHGNGFLTHYGHMLAITVKVGQRVAIGEQIGLEGSTGHSTGPHLHFEVHQGSYKNPIEPTAWMAAHGVTIPGCNTAAAPADDHEH